VALATGGIGLDWGGFGYELACSALGQLPTH